MLSELPDIHVFIRTAVSKCQGGRKFKKKNKNKNIKQSFFSSFSLVLNKNPGEDLAAERTTLIGLLKN